MKVIWKAVITKYDQIITVPKEARFLSVHNQHETLCLWYQCDPALPKEQRIIKIVATGEDFDFSGAFLGTCVMSEGNIIWHVFEIGVM